MTPLIAPMPSVRLPEPFNHAEWYFEPKWDGFRAFVHIDGDQCHLVSRRGRVYTSWPQLQVELAHTIRCRSAVLDGEIVCLDRAGRSHFYNLLFRRDPASFMAFDLVVLNGVDLRRQRLTERKGLLRGIMSTADSRVRLVEHVPERGVDFFASACRHDLEGIVAKWKDGTYQSGPQTSWLNIRNPEYSQWENRRERFEARRDNVSRRANVSPEVALI